jgi:hypothetical protein
MDMCENYLYMYVYVKNKYINASALLHVMYKYAATSDNMVPLTPLKYLVACIQHILVVVFDTSGVPRIRN